MSQQDGQRNTRNEGLHAERDELPAWLRPRQPAKRGTLRRFALVYCALAIIALGLYQFGQQSGLVRLLDSKVDGLLAHAITAFQPLEGQASADASCIRSTS